MLTDIASPSLPENKTSLTPVGLPRKISSTLGGYDMELIHTPCTSYTSFSTQAKQLLFASECR